jgi:transcriptional regulator with XRE-family HTH domain
MEASAEEIARRHEIRRFLMARRAAISPASAGLPGGSRRRTPGLRREEVAALAGVGVTWYTWFEQGRDIRLSPATLSRIARALRLTPSDQAYLFALAGLPADADAPDPDSAGQALQRAVDGFTAGPAMMLDASWNVMAYNRLADLIFEFGAFKGPFARNHLWRLFMDPARREKYVDYEKVAEISVGILRQAHGRRLQDPFLDNLIRDLCDGSEVFRRHWDRQVTTLIHTVEVAMKLPGQSVVRFTSVRLRPVGSEGLLVLLPPADEATAGAMQSLSRRADPTPR